MRNFGAFPAQNYIGTPFAFPVQLSAGLQSQVCPLTFNWLIYGAATAAPNQLVNVSLAGNNVAARMGTVQSVFIDNLGSNASIYVRCMDTGYTVAAQPNSCGWYPIFTNLLTFQIIGMGFVTGSIPTTLVMFSNLRIIPSVDLELATSVSLWLASSTISRGTGIQNTNYGAPALGDQTISFGDLFTAGVPANGAVFHDNLFGTPLATGFIYLTHIDVWSASQAGAAGRTTWTLQSAGASGILFNFVIPNAMPNGTIIKQLQLNNTNLKLDATQQWQLFCIQNGTVGANFQNINHTIVWTTNPN